MTTSSELEPVSPGVLALAQSGAAYTDVVEAMLRGAEPPPPAQDKEFPPMPAVITELSDEARGALRDLQALFGQVNLADRRALTPSELNSLGQEDLAIRAVLKAFKARADVIAELVRVHADAAAEERGAVVRREVRRITAGSDEEDVIIPATPRDPRGHYLLSAENGKPYRIPIPGTSKEWSLEHHSGGVTYDMPDLLRMVADGEVSRAEFRAMTRPVLDEQKAAAFMTARPGRALQILKRITRTGPASNYLNVRSPQARKS